VQPFGYKTPSDSVIDRQESQDSQHNGQIEHRAKMVWFTYCYYGAI